MTADSNDYCVDCKIDTILIGEYYSVYPDVWAKSGLGPHDGMLCIGCLESRIGFLLNSSHFTDYPINYSFYQSPRLISRIYSSQKVS